MSDEEVQKAKKKGEAWGLPDFSATVRFALKKLAVPKSDSAKHIRKNFGDVLAALSDD